MLKDQPQLCEEAVDTVTHICDQQSVHRPCCRFWDWTKGAPPAATAWIGDARRLGDAEVCEAVMDSISKEVDNCLMLYATTVFTPPPNKAHKTAVELSPRTAAADGVQPRSLESELSMPAASSQCRVRQFCYRVEGGLLMRLSRALVL